VPTAQRLLKLEKDGQYEPETPRLFTGIKMRIETVLENMWQDYLVLNPEAQ
jgi:hypothetical protein